MIKATVDVSTVTEVDLKFSKAGKCRTRPGFSGIETALDEFLRFCDSRAELGPDFRVLRLELEVRNSLCGCRTRPGFSGIETSPPPPPL